MRWNLYLTAFHAGLLALGACASTPLRVATPFCAPPQANSIDQMEAGESLSAGTRQAQLAALLGLGDALKQRLQGPLVGEQRMQVLERIERARLTIDAISAELDCEGERTQQAADYLAHKQSSTVQTLTVASLATAAIIGVTSVLLSTSKASPTLQNNVGIGGAVSTAGLGLATLYVSPTIHFEHTRNPLRDIWEGPAQSQIYPPIVWAYLSRAVFSNAQDASIRSKIVARFHQLGAADEDSHTLQLLFGRGGEFDSDTLRIQAALLNQVKAEVTLQNQDLEALASGLLN